MSQNSFRKADQTARAQKPPFSRRQPCNNCPYRKNAPLQLWSVAEFVDLQASEQSELGTVYGCHKNDGCVCIGWLMNQDKNDFPSIKLRMTMTRHKVTHEYLDTLHSPDPLYDSVAEMCTANYPDVFPPTQP